jgi:hypothetical protein
MKFKPAIRKLRGAICSAMGKKLEEFKSEYSTWGVELETPLGLFDITEQQLKAALCKYIAHLLYLAH